MTKDDINKIIAELKAIGDDVMLSDEDRQQKINKAAIIKRAIRHCITCSKSSQGEQISDSLSCQMLLLRTKMLIERVDDDRLKKVASKISYSLALF